MKIPSITLLLSLTLASTITAAPWTTGGPRGGYFESLSATASNPSVVYAAGGQGVFRTDDNGATWRDVSSGLGATRLVVADPFDPNTAWTIAAGDIRPAHRTNDGGATWTLLETGLKRTSAIVVDPNDAKTLYAAADCGNYLEPFTEGSGIRKSTDGGRTWRPASAGLTASIGVCVSQLTLDPANTAHLFAQLQYDRAWESFDGGSSWARTSGAIPTREVVIDPYQPAVRYGTDGRQVVRSDDGGVHWSPQAAAGMPPDPVSVPRLADLSLDPVTPRIFSATAAGLFRSGDGGKSWVPAGDVPRIRVNSVVFNPNESTVMIGTSQGVFRAPSPAFTPWTRLDVPESAILVEQIAVDPRRSSIVYASTADNFVGVSQGRIFRSRDGGGSWERIGGEFVWRARVGVDASGDLWFAAINSTTLQRVPAGTNEVTAIARTFSPISTIAAHPTVPGRVFAGSASGQIVRSSDAGATWTTCQSVGSPLLQLALDPSSDTVFAASGRGAYRSTDGCATFERVAENETMMIAAAPSNPSIVYRSAKDSSLVGRIWRSEDGGTTWTAATPLPFGSLGAAEPIVVDPRDAQRLWIAHGAQGVWESADGGASWRNLSDGLPVHGATALAIDSGGNVLHAGATARGVWELRVRGRQRAVRRP